MIKFDEKQILEEGQQGYELRSEIEELADKMTKQGFENIILVGIGGTWGEFYGVQHILKHYTDFPVYLENAAEFVIKEDRRYLTDKSLVITTSASGNTKEIIESQNLCNEIGATIIGFSQDAGSPVAENSTYHITLPGEDGYLSYFMLTFKLLNNRGEFDDYEQFADEMKNFTPELVKVMKEQDDKLAAIAKSLHKEPYTMFTASGTLWGEAYILTTCVLEEMQWIKTRLVTSPDFFHGPFELVDEDMPLVIIKGEDEYRVLDDRVENFAEKVGGDKVFIIDTKDLKLDGISDKFKVICTPMLLSNLLGYRLAVHYEQKTGHSLEFRRYYRQIDY